MHVEAAIHEPGHAAPSPSDAPFTLMGLSPCEIHDAYWAARGMQCVRRGVTKEIDSSAEVYLLLEPDQLVHMDPASLVERLLWNHAHAMRLRVVDAEERRYGEHLVTDERGCIVRIERRYRPLARAASQVRLTVKARLARLWSNAPSRRTGWDQVRRATTWDRVDHWKADGVVAASGDDAGSRAVISAIVESWPDPMRAIDGLRELAPGVFAAKGQAPPNGATLVGPLWLGAGAQRLKRRCIVGPYWRADTEATADRPAVRPIAEIEPGEGVHVTAQSAASREAYLSVKRLTDVVLSATALILLLPVLAASALLVLVEDGRPIFFAQRRQGRGGRVFMCWKFRTMHLNAEAMARDLAQYNRCDGPQVFIEHDPRVTRAGRFLRKTNLDELPQLINVLLGHMSLVGPRPSPQRENQFCPAWRDLRLSVRPGLTGLWQLRRTRAAGEDFQEWIRFDIEYVRRMSIAFDIAILARTAWMLFRKAVGRAHE